jgi:hypothetical protein
MASPYDDILKSLPGRTPISTEVDKIPAEDNNEISTAASILAGIGSGLFKIPEGLVSLGATLMDLGADTNKAAEVEEWFSNINPFDEAAEATTAGKITELITNLAVPGGVAFKAGSALAKGALTASKSGKYLSVTGQAGKNISKGIQKNLELNRKGKAIQFGAGSLGGGVAEGIFVGDVEDAGTFGDLLGGPTQLERELEGDIYDPERELLNRLKFGTEGALFTAGLGGVGTIISKLRNTTNAGKVVDGKFNKFIDKWISQPLRARGKQTQEAFEQGRRLEGSQAADLNQVENIVRELDSGISRLFPFTKRLWMDKTTRDTRKELLSKMNKVLLSSSDSPNKLTPSYKMNKEGIESVGFGSMNKKLQNEFSKDLKKLGAKTKDIDNIFDNLSAIRIGWGQLFTSMGRRLDEKGAKTFQELFGNKVTTWLDSTYEVFKNRKSKIGELYTPSKEVMDTAKTSFKKLYRDSTGKTLSDAAAQQEVLKVYNSAKLEKGFKLKSQSDPYFQLPDFFLGKSSADEALNINPSRLSELTGTKKQVIEDLFGKSNDAFQTILNGTNKLSTIVRRNEYFDNLLNKSNELRAAGKTPTFANTRDEAAKLFGGVEGVDWKAITPVKVTKRGAQGVEVLDPNLDYAQTLKPLKGETKPIYKKGEVDMEVPIVNPLQTKFALTGTVDGIVRPVDDLANSTGMVSQLYQNLILYPKATSQMAKTILSPFTHGRNFLSAGAFAMANGIIPLADPQAVKQAWNALQVAGPGTRKSNAFYQKLLKLGVVNSQVQLGDLSALLKDVNFGGIAGTLSQGDNLASYGLNRLLKVLSKTKKFAQDAYTAEDDFWKIFSFLGETKRLENAYNKAGVKLGQSFTDMKGNKVRLTKELIEEEAASIVKNNIPNYAYVSEFVKGLRKLPLGNFVSFPAEIMRTGTNVVQRGLDEIFYSTTINGKKVNPFRTIGLQRLSGMAFTTAAVPYAAVQAASAIYDVTEDERKALRNYVAKWSKNSTLVPIRDKETGKFKVIDFSHSNAYDTLTRPIQTIINKVQDGEQDKDGMMDDFLLGLVESTKEIGSPFVSESIWTEALSDLVMRGGRTRDGFAVWNREDDAGTKMYKGVAHLMQSQAPLNWKQLERLNLAIKPTDDLGRFDKRGKSYELGDELQGMFGFRAVEVDPNKSIKYKIADYKRRSRNSKALFTTEVLKGGVVTPKEILDAYINSNQALFDTQKEMYQAIEDAKILGAEKNDLTKQLVDGLGKKGYGRISEGIFTPLNVSKEVIQGFQRIADELGIKNPILDSIGAIGNIRGQLFNVGLDEEEELPPLENPFDKLPLPTLEGTPVGQLPPNITGASPTAGFVGQQNVNLRGVSFETLPESERYKTLFPNG